MGTMTNDEKAAEANRRIEELSRNNGTEGPVKKVGLQDAVRHYLPFLIGASSFFVQMAIISQVDLDSDPGNKEARAANELAQTIVTGINDTVDACGITETEWDDVARKQNMRWAKDEEQASDVEA